jgi:hypothetical protein
VSDPRWATWPDDRLLELRLCELAPDLRVEGTLLEATITQLATELAARDLVFRPHFWLSDEFYTPDGVPGIALPFYLAHPRLCRLEEHQMLEVEGGTPDWCLRILRHEAGHAIDNALRSAGGRSAGSCSGSPHCRTPSTTPRGPTAGASCSTSTPGTRRATRTRTSPRPSPSG